MKTSCGAILYTFDPNGVLGIILGSEGSDEWLPFKGCNEPGETFEETAIREIKEETCGLVSLESVNLEHVFTTKHKVYRIGLCFVEYDLIAKFRQARLLENRKEFREKQDLRFFPLESIYAQNMVHSISRASVKFYWDKLIALSGNTIPATSTSHVRCHGMTEVQAEALRDQARARLVDLPDSEKVDRSMSDPTDMVDARVIEAGDVNAVADAEVDVPADAVIDIDGDTIICNEPCTRVKKMAIRGVNESSSDDSDGSPKYKPPRSRNPESFQDQTKMPGNPYDRKKYAKRKYNLSRPQRVNMSFTPAAERDAEERRVWRGK
jgi:ADP-ribose pyrophosphatase YjhB (NUDIX family)